MGEVAEMMLDGTLCEACGDYLGEQDWGIPRYCPGCGPDLTELPEEPEKPKIEKVRCKHCKKALTPDGMEQHVTHVHKKLTWWPKDKQHPSYRTKKIDWVKAKDKS